MKTSTLLLTLGFILNVVVLQAQETNTSKFNIVAYGGIGYTKVINDDAPNYDLNVNTGDLLLSYNAWKTIGIATGLGYSELSGNGFNTNGNFYQERTVIKIPLLLTLNKDITEHLIVTGNFGFYGQTIVKDEFQYIDSIEKDVYEGFNFGMQLGLGIGYRFDERLGFGVHLNSQSDFSSFETSNNATFKNEQKHKNLTSIGIFATLKL
ncbi:PorT family protein [Bizionia gelidisalsuginis]|uniref:PorT family protein n=1 Tax=Bizionia gelidisalsuginis TaxID=291188 RepID=A0ABY3M843_9FLAO|nr:outer membrane beta-barrel protein [Bizionia gelidisalsuginis]TYC09704.1 PorT family protein [Bizionia gelidisalsuginis]